MADRVIEDIKTRLDIVDVISGYIQLKRSGANFKAACPFHNEKTASLMVSPTKQIWHCFGCNEGGDVFGFVTRYENIEFKDALKMLADRAGVQLPEYSPGQQRREQERERLIRINSFAAKFYHAQLLGSQGSEARQYLQNRGVSSQTITNWQIGFAPQDFHVLEESLRTKNVSVDELVKAGVSVRGDKGSIYDRFRGRITFPIYNYLGDVVGFSARILEANDTSAKYVNSPETPVYSKSAILFGLNFAKSYIRKQDFVIVVEGQLDCISLHQAGFANTVATSGTALTEEQLRLLGRLTKNIKFCFDSDNAGQAASQRAGMLALGLGFAVKVVVLPSGKDPDELVRKDSKAWHTALMEGPWFIDHFINQGLSEYKAGSLEQKQFISRVLIPMVRLVQDPLEQDHYIRKLIEQFTVGEKAVREMLKGGQSAHTLTQEPQVAEQSIVPSGPSLLEKQVLGGLLYSPTFRKATLQDLALDDFTDSTVRSLVEQVPIQGPIPESIMNHTLAREAQFMVESELDLGGETAASLDGALQKSLYTLRLKRVKQEQQVVAESMKQAESQKDAPETERLRNEFAQLTAKRLQLENKINEN